MVAAAGQCPVVNTQAGLQALRQDVPRVLKTLGASSLEELGWIQIDALTMLIPLSASINGITDHYLLKLGFHCYPDWPPSAQFVNPETKQYAWPADQHCVPKLESPECRTHPNYTSPRCLGIQLICCSATLEFYDVLHDVQPHHVWNGKSTFFTTLKAIQRAMQSHYMGRFPRHE
ncbi:MAG TPA: hypothetical protein VN039_13215 [Nitrospira sp.]|nr:hypothetical protein [Nitrospira sp.]